MIDIEKFKNIWELWSNDKLSKDESDFLLKNVNGFPYEEEMRFLTHSVDSFQKFLERKDFQELGKIYENVEKMNYSFTFNDDIKINLLRKRLAMEKIPRI